MRYYFTSYCILLCFAVARYRFNMVNFIILVYGNGDQVCSITVEIPGGAQLTVEDAFTYTEAITPTVIQVTPNRGGTLGGTQITISGNNFA